MTVGVVSPAGPATESRAEAGLAELRSLGFHLKEFPLEASARPYLAGSDPSRCRALERAFSDSEIDAVWCLRGGYGSVRLLPSLDLQRIRRHPKPFIGFSDVTALLGHFRKNVLSGLFHGPVVTQLPDLDSVSRKHLLAMLAGYTDTIPLASDRRVLRSGVVSGPLTGGNLAILCSLVGTPYCPDLTGKILFIEDVNEPPYRVDRMMTQLRLSGHLQGIKGLLVGRFTGTSPSYASTFTGLWEEVASWVEGPVVVGLPVGHRAENVTIPIGVSVRFDTESEGLKLEERLFV